MGAGSAGSSGRVIAMDSTAYYDRNADEFVERTRGLDMSAIYERFLAHIAPGGHILDAGCGSGRDSLAFMDLGYRVTAFDASAEMCARASDVLRQPVVKLRFQDIEWQEEFEGIWACASLLHVPQAELVDVVRRLCTALKPQGVLYVSFKLGAGERESSGRLFNDQTAVSVRCLLGEVSGLSLMQIWETTSAKPSNPAERWINALAARSVSR